MLRATALLFAALALALPLHAADPPLSITRAPSSITIDGDLSDAAWQNALRFDTWYETNPGDSVEPKVKTIGWITYDDRFFYAAIESLDPTPSAIRAWQTDPRGMSLLEYTGLRRSEYGTLVRDDLPVAELLRRRSAAPLAA